MLNKRKRKPKKKMLEDIKPQLRISSSQTAFDLEIQELIDSARQDLILSGVAVDRANDDTDPLIRRAISVYVKAHFGWDNPDADRLEQSFFMLKSHLTLSQEYTQEGDS